MTVEVDDQGFLFVREMPEQGIILAVIPLFAGTARLTLSYSAEWPMTYSDGW